MRWIGVPEVYSEPSRTFKSNEFQSLTVFAKSSILDVRLDSEYAYGCVYYLHMKKCNEPYYSTFSFFLIDGYCKEILQQKAIVPNAKYI